MTLTYVYSESTAVVGPLATFSEPHAYDLCAVHGARLKVPHGWNVIKQELDGQTQGPTEDDLMAIADAVREVHLKKFQKKHLLKVHRHNSKLVVVDIYALFLLRKI